MSNDEYALVEDIKTELKPIVNFLEVISIDGEINSIGLKPGINLKQLKLYGYIPEQTTRKQFIKLLDLLNDNKKAFEMALKEVVQDGD